MSVAIRSGLKKEGRPFGVLLSGWFLFPDDGMSDASAYEQSVRGLLYFRTSAKR
jgi:hypothetical protein